jgi:hypothetical protein
MVDAVIVDHDWLSSTSTVGHVEDLRSELGSRSSVLVARKSNLLDRSF